MIRGRSLAAGVSLALLGTAVLPALGNTQESLTDKNAIVACMLEKSGAQDKAVMRETIIAALQENEEAMRANLIRLSAVLIDLAVTKCRMSYTLMNEKDFGEIGAIYGEKLGNDLISAAFAKLK
jgi:hypothetical protein